MALTRLGTSNFNDADYTGTFEVTVPANTTLAVLVVTGWCSDSNIFPSATITLDGNELTYAISVDTGGDQTAIFYRAASSFTSGAVDLEWTLDTTTNFGDGGQWMLAYYSGVDISSPIRDSDYDSKSDASSTETLTSPRLTAVSGDVAITGLYVWDSENPSSVTWTNATSLHGELYNSSWGDMAESTPSGDFSITADPGGNSGNVLWINEVIVVFKPSGTVSASPSRSPSASPSVSPSGSPSASPSASPSVSPSASLSPSASPSVSPSASPSTPPVYHVKDVVLYAPVYHVKDIILYSPVSSASPSVSPSGSPSASPSGSPSESPSGSPSASPSVSLSPSVSPSKSPSGSPSRSPSKSPSVSPSASVSPSRSPSASPSASTSPSASPSVPPAPNTNILLRGRGLGGRIF